MLSVYNDVIFTGRFCLQLPSSLAAANVILSLLQPLVVDSALSMGAIDNSNTWRGVIGQISLTLILV